MKKPISLYILAAIFCGFANAGLTPLLEKRGETLSAITRILLPQHHERECKLALTSSIEDPLIHGIPDHLKYAYTNPPVSDRRQLEENLSELQDRCEKKYGIDGCERQGIFGPSSVVWQLFSQPQFTIFGVLELTLQLAHPGAAPGVIRHSLELRKTPLTRLGRTIHQLAVPIFGRFSQAQNFSRRLFSIHQRIEGIMGYDAGFYTASDRYSAVNPASALWINATEFLFRRLAFTQFFRPLTTDEEIRYFNEFVDWNLLFGIPKKYIPSTPEQFDEYVLAMMTSGALTFTEESLRFEREVRENFRGSLTSRWERLAFDTVMGIEDALTAALLPAGLSSQLRPNATGVLRRISFESFYRTMAFVGRQTVRVSPPVLLNLPHYRIALARAQGKPAELSDLMLQREVLNSVGLKKGIGVGENE